MRLVSLKLRSFRSYADQELRFGEAVTVLIGANGVGKTNLLEATYFACTARSCRTSNERELVRFGDGTTRVELTVEDADGPHGLAVGFSPGQAKRITVDGAVVERLADSPHKPLVSVFLPDRLELIKGTPALRRAHLDQVIAALWPARALTRRRYAQVLAQRNALIGRIRAGFSAVTGLADWDRQLAVSGLALMRDRAEAVAELAPAFAHAGERLGLGSATAVSLELRPRVKTDEPAAFAEELRERWESDVQRGFTGHGPHRDDLALQLDGRELRAYGSQGQQRLALLALLLAERDVLARIAGRQPVMLLDDVTSELDTQRRRALVDLLMEQGGQSLITATDLGQLPDFDPEALTVVAVQDGRAEPLSVMAHRTAAAPAPATGERAASA